MKFRMGFVSNSSSSSFIIQKRDLNPLQLLELQYIVHEADKLFWEKELKRVYEENKLELGEHLSSYYDVWEMEETDDSFKFSTDLDNFAMNAYIRERFKISESIMK